jgi:hypothetical protein
VFACVTCTLLDHLAVESFDRTYATHKTKPDGHRWMAKPHNPVRSLCHPKGIEYKPPMECNHCSSTESGLSSMGQNSFRSLTTRFPISWLTFNLFGSPCQIDRLRYTRRREGVSGSDERGSIGPFRRIRFRSMERSILLMKSVARIHHLSVPYISAQSTFHHLFRFVPLSFGSESRDESQIVVGSLTRLLVLLLTFMN